MGCHTWYKKPLIKGKTNVQKYLRAEIEAMRTTKWWNDTCEEEAIIAFKAIDELDENMDESLRHYLSFQFPVDFIDGVPIMFDHANEYQTDEPRVNGYPETMIRSADEMFKAMETGLINSKGEHCKFYWDEERDEFIRKNIINFFTTYPDGIIEFG